MNKYIAKIVLVLLVGFGMMTSCDSNPEGTIYNSKSIDVAFYSTQLNTELTQENNGVLEVPIYRGGKNGEASVKVQMDSKTVAQGLFTLTTPSVTFGDGKSSSVAKIAFDLSKLGVVNTYTIVLSLTDSTEFSPSIVNSVKIKVQRKLT